MPPSEGNRLHDEAAAGIKPRRITSDEASVWNLRLGRGRKHALLLTAQRIGAAGVLASAVVLAYLLHASWPPSMGIIHRTWTDAPALFLGVVQAPEFRPFVPCFLLAPVIYLLLLQWLHLYHQSATDVRPFHGAGAILKATVIGTLFLALLRLSHISVLPIGSFQDGVEFLGYLMLLVFFGTLLFHSGTLILVLTLRALNIGRCRLAVIEAGQAPTELYKALETPGSPFNFLGTIGIGDAPSGPGLDTPKRLGKINRLDELINQHDLDEVVLAVDPSILTPDQRLEVAQTCWNLGTELKMVTPFYPFFHTRPEPEMVGYVPVLHVERIGLYATYPQILKRGMDVLACAAGLVILSPFFLLAMVAVKLDSPGPVFFHQMRVGLNGRTFKMIKLRSMIHNASDAIHKEYLKQLIAANEASETDKSGNAVYKMTNDPRITRVGWIIRKTSIDELPQLWNVIRGDMSLVGPRPPLPYEVEQYEDWHLKRLHIRPGITGLWQVSGRSRLSFEEMVRLDIHYIENWSLWKDIKILLLTIPVLLKPDQSY